MEKDNTNEKIRSSWMDNAKAILIFLVVLGHFISLGEKGDLHIYYKYLHEMIYIFHMPALFFISGYLSQKSESNYLHAFKECLIPYLILCFVMYAFIYCLNGEAKLSIIVPPTIIWYLWNLFFYRLVGPIIDKLRAPIVVVLIIGISIGFTDKMSTVFSMGRLFSFFPYFAMGWRFPKKLMGEMEKRNILRIVIGVSGLLCMAIAAFILKKNNITEQVLWMKRSYEQMKMTNLQGAALRMIVYVLGTVGSISIIFLAPVKKCFFTYIGINSISVYIIHIFALRITDKTDWLNESSLRNAVITVLLSLLITFVFAAPFFTKCYKVFISTFNKLLFKE